MTLNVAKQKSPFLESILLLRTHPVFETLSRKNTHFGLYHPKGLPIVSKHSRIPVVEHLKKAKIEPAVLKFFEKSRLYALYRNLRIRESGLWWGAGLFDISKSDPLFADQKLC